MTTEKALIKMEKPSWMPNSLEILLALKDLTVDVLNETITAPRNTALYYRTWIKAQIAAYEMVNAFTMDVEAGEFVRLKLAELRKEIE